MSEKQKMYPNDGDIFMLVNDSDLKKFNEIWKSLDASFFDSAFQQMNANQSITNADIQRTNDSNTIADSNEVVAQISIENLNNSLSSINFSKSQSIHRDLPKEHLPVLKSSHSGNTINLNANGQLIRTGQSLRLVIPPSKYQRARYGKELLNTIRYISVPENDFLTLQMPDIKTYGPQNASIWLRITRITIPDQTNNYVLRHLYPILYNSKYAEVYNGSLLIPINDPLIQIEYLTMQRLKLNELRTTESFFIHSSTKLDENEKHQTNISSIRKIRDNYQLRYSVLQFQIIFIDEKQTAYPTDLQCQTEPICEYDSQEYKNCSSTNMKNKKKSIRRKQNVCRKRLKTMKNKMAVKKANS